MGTFDRATLGKSGRSFPTGARAVAYGRDDREALALLLLPFLIMALAIGISQSMRPGGRFLDLAGPRLGPIGGVDSGAGTPRTLPPVAAPSASAPAPHVAIGPGPRPVDPAPATVPVQPAPPLRLPPPLLRLPADPPRLATAADVRSALALNVPPRYPDAAPPVAVPALALPPVAFRLPLAPPPQPAFALALPAAGPLPLPTPRLPTFDLALAPPAFQLPDTGPALPRHGIALTHPAHPALVIPDRAPPLPARPPVTAVPPPQQANVCLPAARSSASPSVFAPGSLGAEQFGRQLAAAARAQTSELVVYNDQYRRIAYPMGDVPAQFGVCTDVLIRAYRALGIDLQALVQAAGVGSGDPSIDHRRVETLRRFFTAKGAALPVTDFAEDYRPGDIVSYWRPQNQHSRTHIAIVADAIGPSGRPMIIHNRGWGPQLEDGLFVDRITGHYRFAGPAAVAANPVLASARIAPQRARLASAPILKSRTQRRPEPGPAGAPHAP